MGQCERAAFCVKREEQEQLVLRNSRIGDFPGGPVTKNLPYNAGDAGSIPGQGTKIPHAAGQLSPRATTTELAHSGPCTPQLERSPCATTKSLHAATKTRRSQK